MVCSLYKAIDLHELNSNEVSVEISGIFCHHPFAFFHLAAGFTVDGRAFKLRVSLRPTCKTIN